MSVPTATYDFEVEGLGRFRARKRTMRDAFRLEAEKERILGGETSNKQLENAASAFAEVTIFVETGPEGWDVNALDPLDPSDVDRLFKVAGELRAAESRFRGRA